MVLFISIVAAVVPTVAYVGLIYWVDRYEKEPLPLLGAAFLWGALPGILLSFLANGLLSAPFYLVDQSLGDIVGASAIAPFVEESVKGLALVGILLFWRHELDSPLDGIIYGAMVGMGFAMVENIFYFVSVHKELGASAWRLNIFMRAYVFGLNHALFTGMTGLGIAVARLSPSKFTRVLAPLVGWSTGVLFHALHNASASIGGVLCLLLFVSDFGGVLLTLTIIVWVLWQESQWIKHYLAEEVTAQVLSQEQHRKASSTLQRSAHGLSLLLGGNPRGFLRAHRFYERCAELAHKKHHYSLFGREDDRQRAARLRAEITAQSQELV